MVHQLIDVCRANQSQLTGLRVEVATLRSLVNTLVRPFTPPAMVKREVLCQKFLRGGSGRLDASPVFAAAKVVLLQFRTVVVCQDHCTSPRCNVHGRQTRSQERHCRFRGCQARVPAECSSGFCDEHCSSPQCSVHIFARPRCTLGCCAVHCTHSQYSPQGSTRPPRVTRTPNVFSNV